MVNRIWQEHFGVGIVPTASNFGRQGEAPTNPELLDWLAVEFVNRGWSIKEMHRLMLNSNAYKMSSAFNAHNAKVDPENKLLWRANPRRLNAEELRDSVLAVSGRLNLQVGGPPVFPYLSDEERGAIAGGPLKWPISLSEDAQNRRGVYLFVKRAYRYPMFEIFDSPDAMTSCERRSVTNVAPQALAMLNNRFIYTQAQELAKRLRTDAGDDPAAWVTHGFRLALGRSPSAGEAARALQLLADDGSQATSTTAKTTAKVSAQTTPAGLDRALTRFCLMLFNLNEFMFID
jgi:hypothetical protein